MRSICRPLALLLAAVIASSQAATSYYKVKVTNIHLVRSGNTVDIEGDFLGVVARNLTFGLDKSNFTVIGENATLIVDIHSKHDTSNHLGFTTTVAYDADVWVNWTEVGEISVKYKGTAAVDQDPWPTDDIQSSTGLLYLELPWMGFVNKTVLDDAGEPKSVPYEIFLDESGLGTEALFNLTDAAFYGEIDAINATIPGEADMKASSRVGYDYVGFAMEWSNAPWYFRQPGTDPADLVLNQNVINFLKNMRHLNVGVNGNSGMLTYLENTTLPLEELEQYMGAKKELLPISVDDFKMLDKVGTEANAKFIMGAPLLHPNDSRFLVEFVVDGILKHMGTDHIEAIELGNEPDHWAEEKKAFRPHPFTYEEYMGELVPHVDALKAAWPAASGIALGAGPAIAGCNTYAGKVCWQPDLWDFAQRTGELMEYITYHRYGQSGCSEKSTAETLLGDPDPATGDFEWVEELVPKLDGIGKHLVWGEGNALSCGGKEDISDSFAAALWMLDNLFEAASRGVWKANIHADPERAYSPFIVDQDTGDVTVMPIFYGMLAFTRLFEDGNASIFKLNSSVQSRYIKLWGVLNEDTKSLRVVVIHKDMEANGPLTLRIALENATDYETDAVAVRLTAPSYDAKDGIDLAGQTFDGSTDGNINGEHQSEHIPYTDGFIINVDPISAVGIFINRKNSRSFDTAGVEHNAQFSGSVVYGGP